MSSDIKAALTSHIKHDEIDMPEDEPEEAKKVSLLSFCLLFASCNGQPSFEKVMDGDYLLLEIKRQRMATLQSRHVACVPVI